MKYVKPVVDFTNVFMSSFYACKSQKRKKWWSSHQHIFALLGSMTVKPARKMLVILIPAELEAAASSSSLLSSDVVSERSNGGETDLWNLTIENLYFRQGVAKVLPSEDYLWHLCQILGASLSYLLHIYVRKIPKIDIN